MIFKSVYFVLGTYIDIVKTYDYHASVEPNNREVPDHQFFGFSSEIKQNIGIMLGRVNIQYNISYIVNRNTTLIILLVIKLSFVTS